MTHIISSDAEAIEVARRLSARFAVNASKRDAERVLPHAEIQELSDSGLLSISVPREYGGPGASVRTIGEVFTELSTGDSSVGQIPQNHFFFLNVIAHTGTEAQRRFF
jgi:alkylation response protein AidB-like acyl-CoA dehydrogenase